VTTRDVVFGTAISATLFFSAVGAVFLARRGWRSMPERRKLVGSGPAGLRLRGNHLRPSSTEYRASDRLMSTLSRADCLTTFASVAHLQPGRGGWPRGSFE
jgi:hypothetical protein